MLATATELDYESNTEGCNLTVSLVQGNVVVAEETLQVQILDVNEPHGLEIIPGTVTVPADTEEAVVSNMM